MLLAGIVAGFLAAGAVLAMGAGLGWAALAYVLGGDVGLIATGMLAARRRTA